MSYCFDTVAPIYDLVMPKRRPHEFLSMLDANGGTPSSRWARARAASRSTTRPTPGRACCWSRRTGCSSGRSARSPNAVHVQGTAEAMHFGDGTFGKVICFDSIHHWSDQPRGLEEVYRVLEDGGRMLVVEVDPSTFWGGKVAIMERCLGMKSRFHPPEPLMRMMESAGFRDVEFKDVGSDMTYGMVARR